MGYHGFHGVDIGQAVPTCPLIHDIFKILYNV